jgi:ketosteroid isomerase-like protein
MDFDPLSISTYFQRFINHFFNNFKFNIMKKLLLNALFMGLTTLGFAQTTFTEATFKDMMQRYQKQTVEFLKTETTTDFLFIGVSGESMDKESFITFVQGASEFPTNEFTNIKIRQYDNTAIVTGIWSHSHRLKFNNSIVSYKEAVTETFVRQNGKWLYASHQGGFAPTVQADEEAAIKKMLEEEKKASDAADFKAYKSHWVDAPYVSFQYNGLSFVGDAFWKSAEEKFAGRKPTNNITTRSDWNFTIKGAAAFVTFSQKTENVEKKTTYETYEERYVEKVNGEWKMVNMTAIKKAN